MAVQVASVDGSPHRRPYELVVTHGLGDIEGLAEHQAFVGNMSNVASTAASSREDEAMDCFISEHLEEARE